jgi:hypothetical protein
MQMLGQKCGLHMSTTKYITKNTKYNVHKAFNHVKGGKNIKNITKFFFIKNIAYTAISTPKIAINKSRREPSYVDMQLYYRNETRGMQRLQKYKTNWKSTRLTVIYRMFNVF